MIQVLLAECAAGDVTRWQPCHVKNIVKSEAGPSTDGASSYRIESDKGLIETSQVVIATGGLSIPKIGASDNLQSSGSTWASFTFDDVFDVTGLPVG